MLGGVLLGGLLSPVATYILDWLQRRRRRKVVARQLWAILFDARSSLELAAKLRAIGMLAPGLDSKLDALDLAPLLEVLSDDGWTDLVIAEEVIREASLMRADPSTPAPLPNDVVEALRQWSSKMEPALKVAGAYALREMRGQLPPLPGLDAAQEERQDESCE